MPIMTAARRHRAFSSGARARQQGRALSPVQVGASVSSQLIPSMIFNHDEGQLREMVRARAWCAATASGVAENQASASMRTPAS